MDNTPSNLDLPLPSRSRRRLYLLGAVMALVLLGAAWFGWRAYTRYQIRKDLEAAVAEMDRTEPGWRLEDMEAAREQVPDGENAALIVTEAAKLIPNDLLGRIDGMGSPYVPANRRFGPREVAKQTALLEPCRDAVLRLRGAEKLDRGRFPIVYSPDAFGTKLNHVDDCRRLASLLRAATERRLDGGDVWEAIFLTRLRMSSAIGDEPLTISELCRLQCVWEACYSVERVLSLATPMSEDLTSVQALLQREARRDILSRIIRSERACIHRAFEYVAEGNVRITDPEGLEKKFPSLAKAVRDPDGVRKEHPELFRIMRRYLDIANVPVPARDLAMAEFEAELEAMPKGLLSFLRPGIGKIDRAIRGRQAYFRCTVIAIACERYRLQHGDWPARLDDIRPLVDEQILEDPCNAKPLHYRRVADGVLIWSAGRDGEDNDGNLSHGGERGTDVGVRLWNVAQRGLPPLPEEPEPDAGDGGAPGAPPARIP